MSMKKLILSALFIILTIFFLVGCTESTKFKGATENWEVEVMQKGNLEQVQYRFKYLGVEQSIESFSYRFESLNLNSSGTLSKTNSIPFIYETNIRFIGQKKIEVPLTATIGWNGKKEEIKLE